MAPNSMSAEAHIARLPHRRPFLFLTRVDSIDAGVGASGVWEVTGEESFFAGHFPGEPIIPGVLIAEALAQLAGVCAGRSGRAPGRLAHINVKFVTTIRPPAAIALEARVSKSMGDLWLFDVTASVNGQLAAGGALALAFSSTESDS
jgi:3-hydroxyacyl-[acyl-carrier-protein] dehydratase